MGWLRDCYKFKANSLLESVIALSIISICLYIAIMVYSKVFTKKTSLETYSENYKASEIFFLMETANDSIYNYFPSDKWGVLIEEEYGVRKVIVTRKDDPGFNKTYYLSE